MTQRRYPEPGRLVSLGAKIDRLDAEAMIAVLRAAAGVRERHSVSMASHMAREALWNCWEWPRLPRPIVASKYPTSWPWSPGSRLIFEGTGGRRPKDGGWGLIFEHLAPRGLLITGLIEDSVRLNPTAFIKRLGIDMRGTVVSRAEAKLLDGAKVGQRYPVGVDPTAQPWCRYVHAGLDPSTFKPLNV